MKLSERQWALVDALRAGKTLLYSDQEIPYFDEIVWMHHIIHYPDSISIAPEAVVTRLYGHLCGDGHWSMTSRGCLGCDTHYMEIDSAGKQVTPITKLEGES